MRRVPTFPGTMRAWTVGEPYSRQRRTDGVSQDVQETVHWMFPAPIAAIRSVAGKSISDGGNKASTTTHHFFVRS